VCKPQPADLACGVKRRTGPDRISAEQTYNNSEDTEESEEGGDDDQPKSINQPINERIVNFQQASGSTLPRIPT
jgi:hypothetical protein